MPLTSVDLEHLCPHAERSRHEAVIAYVQTDKACTQLFLAYCFAKRARCWLYAAQREHNEQMAQEHFNQGTNILWNRLRDPAQGSLDVNIQAVLLLVAFTSDFGQSGESDIHADALRTMISERGGLASITGNDILQQQLEAVDISRVWHLTLGCQSACEARFRFTDGFWSGKA